MHLRRLSSFLAVATTLLGIASCVEPLPETPARGEWEPPRAPGVQVSIWPNKTHVGWSLSNNGGAPVTSWRVWTIPPVPHVKLVGNGAELRGFESGMQYFVAVQGEGPGGLGAVGYSAPFRAGIEGPPPPVNVQCSANGDGTFTVSWDPPVETAGVATLRYTVFEENLYSNTLVSTTATLATLRPLSVLNRIAVAGENLTGQGLKAFSSCLQ